MPLDPSQRHAATCDAPIQLTLAGPGSGKTSTLTGRFIHLVRQGVDPRRILAVTFTKKAVEEMRQRISAALPDLLPKQLEIFTFHGFAYRCLRRNPAAAGLPSTVQIWDTPEQRAVFSKRRMYWNEDEDILDIIGSAKERLLDARTFEAALSRGEEVGKSAVEFFRVYEEALNRAGAIDFADMVPRLVQAMDRDPHHGRSIVRAYDHLLVDEYQDVNPGQDLLISHFVRAGVKLWAVGDDDQTLYAFRASDVEYILNFQERYPGSQVHILDRNYRSAPGIVRTAKKLIRKNEGRVDKDYSAVNQGSCDIVVRGYSMPAVEARQVAAAISQLISDGLEPRQMAVLYRSGTIGLHFQAALRALDIPFEVRGAGDFWQSSPAKLFVGSLHYLRDPRSTAALEKMGTGKRGDITRERLDLIDRRTRRDFQSSCAQVRRIVAEALPIRASGRERAEWESIVDGVAMLAASCSSVEELEARIAEQTQAAKRPHANSVVLSTVHSAKGLEWDTVFVVGLEDGVMPHGNSADIEEERRVAYVAVTRAKRRLALTYAAERFGTKSDPSPFLFEMHHPEVIWTGPNMAGADSRLPLASLGERAQLATKRSHPTSGPTARRTSRETASPGSRPWTSREDTRLQAAYASSSSLEEMSLILKRSPDEIVSRLVALKFLPSRNPHDALSAEYLRRSLR